MSDRLNYLLTRFLAKEASVSEIEELRSMAGLPEHESHIREAIDNAFDSEMEDADLRSEIGGKIYERIKKENHMAPARHFWRPLRWVAAAATVALVVGLGWHFSTNRQPENLTATTAPVKPEANRTYRNKSYVRLPDGSTVMLKDSSVLIAMNENGKFKREVFLEGEAYFDIAHDASHTFVVHAGKVHTRVLGTAFNVATQTGKVEVKVTRGLVEVGNGQIVYGKIKAKEQIQVNTASNAFNISAIKALETAPISNTALNFEETSLTNVFDQIAKKYRYQVFLENPDLGPCRITANFTGKEDLEYIMDAICAIRGLEYTTELDKILIKGGVPCR